MAGVLGSPSASPYDALSTWSTGLGRAQPPQPPPPPPPPARTSRYPLIAALALCVVLSILLSLSVVSSSVAAKRSVSSSPGRGYGVPGGGVVSRQLRELRNELARVICEGLRTGGAGAASGDGPWCMPTMSPEFQAAQVAQFDEAVAEAIVTLIEGDAAVVAAASAAAAAADAAAMGEPPPPTPSAPPPPTLLDVGAGIGAYVAFLRRNGVAASGLDLAVNVDIVTRGLVWHGDAALDAGATPLEQLPGPGGSGGGGVVDGDLLAPGLYDWVMTIGVGERIPAGPATAAFVRRVAAAARRGVIVSWPSAVAAAAADESVAAIAAAAVAPSADRRRRRLKPGSTALPSLPPPPPPPARLLPPPVLQPLSREAVAALFEAEGLVAAEDDALRLRVGAADPVLRRALLVFRWPESPLEAQAAAAAAAAAKAAAAAAKAAAAVPAAPVKPKATPAKPKAAAAPKAKGAAAKSASASSTSAAAAAEAKASPSPAPAAAKAVPVEEGGLGGAGAHEAAPAEAGAALPEAEQHRAAAATIPAGDEAGPLPPMSLGPLRSAASGAGLPKSAAAGRAAPLHTAVAAADAV